MLVSVDEIVISLLLEFLSILTFVPPTNFTVSSATLALPIKSKFGSASLPEVDCLASN